MRKIMPVVGISAAACIVAAVTISSFAGASGAATTGLTSDHALIDQTGGDTKVACASPNAKPFIVYGAFRAFGGDVTMRVRFKDGDFVEYPIAQNASFSFSEAAGGTPTVDRRIVVSTSGGAGDLVGWLSASRSPGSTSFVACATS